MATRPTRSANTPALHGEAKPQQRDVLRDELVEVELLTEAERLTPVILAQLKQHLHLPMQLPDADSLATLREKDPEAHGLWLSESKNQLEHQRFMESARYRIPLMVISSVQRNALVALIAVLIFAGYLVSQDHATLGAVFAAIDIVGILTVFLAPQLGLFDGVDTDE